MAPQYASNQPAGFQNHVENVAIVGAGGQIGGIIAKALLKDGKHKVTAITRPDSTSEMPPGLHDIKKASYDNHQALTEALKGQDALIITMGVMAAEDSSTRLNDAAVEAGVKWIMPSEWGATTLASSLGKIRCSAHPYSPFVDTSRNLGGTEIRYGFDFAQKKVTFFSGGETKIITTTWPQVGRAVSKLFSLKILPENENDKSPHLSQWADATVHVSSFLISQRDMFESVLRVTGDSEKDWEISYEDAKERYQRGAKMLGDGNMMGFSVMLYSRVFYPDGSGDFSDKLDNKVLDLPQESLDEATKVGIEMAKDPPKY